MSRVGKQPIKVDASVKVQVQGDLVRIEGKGGKLSHRLPEGMKVDLKDGKLIVGVPADASPKVLALWGTTRTVLSNMVHGVAASFNSELDIVGVGYRAALKGKVLSLSLGFSHSIEYPIPEGIAIKVDGTHLVVSGADKVLVGQVAAKIRGFRPPEPYQGKGVKYTDERIVRKQGKAAGAK
ncbi:MAG: 50S ribosomal protein L6 [Bdellovibrionales bacterium]|nr:50S ribosomal protein L6 [Bdellovibrionales bacterium]